MQSMLLYSCPEGRDILHYFLDKTLIKCTFVYLFDLLLFYSFIVLSFTFENRLPGCSSSALVTQGTTS
jgi:hypothetical protein